jgi:penicillin-binding protein 1A
MTPMGLTSDYIVAALLAVSQLVTPVSESGIKAGEAAIIERKSCEKFAEASPSLNESCKDKDQIDSDICIEYRNLESACATDKVGSQTLRFVPKPLSAYFQMTNADLLPELNSICNAVHTRIGLDAEEWQKGEIADLGDLARKLTGIAALQPALDEKLVEAQDPESWKTPAEKEKRPLPLPFFNARDATRALTAICHWGVNRQTIAEKHDFTGGLRLLRELLAELPNAQDLPELPQASFVYDDQGGRIGEIYDRKVIRRNGKSYQNLSRRRMVAPEKMPPLLMHAFIAIEDQRFLQHNGFDFESARRLIADGGKSTQGGSTFTMQLIKNAFFGADVEKERAAGGKKRTLRRKIKEILMIPVIEPPGEANAARMERKRKILTYYLNLISMTANAQGVLMAALDLFGVDDLNKLTLAQIGILAALPKATTGLNPWRNPGAAKARRNVVLGNLLAQGYLNDPQTVAEIVENQPSMRFKTAAQIVDAAKAEPIQLVDRVAANRAKIFSRYYVGAIANQFSALKNNQKQRDPRWTQGGFDIQTGYNSELQKIMTKALQTQLRAIDAGKYKPWIDETTGKNINVAVRMSKKDADIRDAFDTLRLAHPAPETNWVIGLKTPKSNKWLLENGQRVSGSSEIFRRLNDWDAATLEEVQKGVYRVAWVPDVQGASVMINVKDGNVLAISGGFTSGAYGKDAQNNRATRAYRQPGSTIKPVIYLYALNHGVQPNDILQGGSVGFPKIEGCGYHWSPANYAGEGGGSIEVKEALAHSMNRPVVNLFMQLAGFPQGSDLTNADAATKIKLENKLHEIYDLAVSFGAYTSRQDLANHRLQQPCFPFLLGGYETTPTNMAQIYAAIANGGLKRDAVFLKSVFKGDDPLEIDRSKERRTEVDQYRAALKQNLMVTPEAFHAIPGVTAQSIAQLRNMMQGVLREGTAAKLADWADLIAGKTGTTNDSRDAWFSAFTNNIAIVTWVGYDRAKTLGSMTGASAALPIFQSIMNRYYELFPEELNDKILLPTDLPGVFTSRSGDFITKSSNSKSKPSNKKKEPGA